MALPGHEFGDSEFIKHPQLLVGNEKTSFLSIGSGTTGNGKTNK